MVPPTTTTTAPPGNSGEELYMTYCSACHGVDGRALSNIQGEKPAKVAKKVIRGVGRVMPSYADILTMGEIDKIGDYVSELGDNGRRRGKRSTMTLTELTSATTSHGRGSGSQLSAADIQRVARLMRTLGR
jgi:hypothetical protein